MDEELAQAIIAELLDPEYSNRKHGKRSCANAGCGGPLCSKATRDHVRNLYYARNPNPKRPRRGATNPELDALLDRVMELHWLARDARTSSPALVG